MHRQQTLIEFAAIADFQPSRRLRYGTTDMLIGEVLDELCRRFVETVGTSLESERPIRALSRSGELRLRATAQSVSVEPL